MPRKSQGIYIRYTKESLQHAVAAIADHNLSFGAASKEFSIPKSTLKDHFHGRSRMNDRPGRKRSIPEDVENDIVDKVIAAAQAGFPITKRQFLIKVGRVVRKLKLKTQFKDSIPGDDYWRCLKERRPDLVIRSAEGCGMNRMAGTTRSIVDRYFLELESLVNNLNLGSKPCCIWNCDETGLQFSPNPGKVLAKKGTRELLCRSSNTKESVTTLVCINASGQAMPPFCVVKGKTFRSVQSFATHDAPADTVWTYQDNAWMCDVLGVEWFQNVFLKHCGPARPQLLILDSHSSHEVVELLDMARQNEIHILALPPHTTHALQPLDKVVFGPFKRAYGRVCTEHMCEDPDNTINKVSWPGLLKKVWDETMKEALLKKAFEATGIVPVNPNRIPDSVFAPSEAFRNRADHVTTKPPAAAPPPFAAPLPAAAPPLVAAPLPAAAPPPFAAPLPAAVPPLVAARLPFAAPPPFAAPLPAATPPPFAASLPAAAGPLFAAPLPAAAPPPFAAPLPAATPSPFAASLPAAAGLLFAASLPAATPSPFAASLPAAAPPPFAAPLPAATPSPFAASLPAATPPPFAAPLPAATPPPFAAPLPAAAGPLFAAPLPAATPPPFAAPLPAAAPLPVFPMDVDALALDAPLPSAVLQPAAPPMAMAGDFVQVRDITGQELLNLQNSSSEIFTMPVTADDIAFLDGLNLQIEGSEIPMKIDLSSEGELPLVPVPVSPQSWHKQVHGIFGLKSPSARPAKPSTKTKKAAAHRVLTSNEVFEMKVALKEEKETKEREKQERKVKAQENRRLREEKKLNSRKAPK